MIVIWVSVRIHGLGLQTGIVSYHMNNHKMNLRCDFYMNNSLSAKKTKGNRGGGGNTEIDNM